MPARGVDTMPTTLPMLTTVPLPALAIAGTTACTYGRGHSPPGFSAQATARVRV